MKGLKELRMSRSQAVLKKSAKPQAVCVLTSLTLFVSFTPLTSYPGASQQAPTFRTRVEVVQLDVSVLDKNRHPVRGLTQDDFTVLEDGKPRKIVGFTAFDHGDEAPAATGWMRDVPPDVTTNDVKPESRLWVIVLDDGLIPQEPFSIASSKKIAASIIEKLGPEDLTAVVFTGDNRKTQDFTNDKTRLLAAIDKFNPGLAGWMFGLTATGLVGPDTDYWFYQSSIRALDSIADFLVSVPGRRKSLFWISPGIPMDLNPGKPQDPRAVPGPPPPPGLPPADMIQLFQRMDDAFRRAQRANVTVYPIDPTGLDGMKQYLLQRMGPANEQLVFRKLAAVQDSLAAAAANTGGRLVANINEFEPGIRDIFAENTSYYLIGFEAGNYVADGKLHRVQVKVNRDDVDVRTRSGYYAREPEKPNTRKAAVSPEAAALAKSIGGLLPTTDLPMKVALAPFAVPGQRLATVAIVLGVKQPIPEAAAKGRVNETTELQISAFTPEGDPRGTQRHTARVTLRPGSDGEAAYEVLGRIDLPAGRYRLRLAAHNVTSKKDGSVFADVVVPDYSNLPVSASSIVLSAVPGRVSAPRDLFANVLPATPTAEREFAPTDRVTAFLRLYQSGDKSIQPAQLTMTIRDAADRIVVTQAMTMPVDQFVVAGQKLLADAPATLSGRPNPLQTGGATTAATADRFANLALRSADVPYQIPISRLMGGPHLLTVEIAMGATVIGRDIRFGVK